MKIVFLCGSLEPGRDGVGDYTRRLAAELTRQKHSASIIALHDWKADEIIHEVQTEDKAEIPVVRLPFGLSLQDKLDVAGKYISAFDPEWVSLQYVPFSFSAKGLPVGLSKLLVQLGKGRKWHIMFHELWLISKTSLPTRRLVTGGLQRALIIQLIKKLKPAVIHTQSQLSQYHLLKIGYQANLLPLFSNISSVAQAPDCSKAKASNSNSISLVSFGSVYLNALIEKFANEAANYQKKSGISITLSIAGRAGIHQQHWTDVWQAAGLQCTLLGPLPSEEISAVLSSATAGISSTPFVMSEKSGTVAAMLEHQLPVICIADPYQPKGFTFQPPEGIIEYCHSNFEDCILYKLDTPHKNNVSLVSQQFSHDLLSVNSTIDKEEQAIQ